MLLLPLSFGYATARKRRIQALFGLAVVYCLVACGGGSTAGSGSPAGGDTPVTGTGGSPTTISVAVYGTAPVNGNGGLLQNSAGTLTLTLTN